MSTDRNEEQAADAAARREGPEFFVLFVRALRVVTIHELDNETARNVLAAFIAKLGAFHARFGQVQVQVVGGETYFNGIFVRRKGPAIEASSQAIELYEKLGISEIAFDKVPPPAESQRFFEVFQRHYRSKAPTAFAKEPFDGIRIRIAETGPGKAKDSQGRVADLYAELAAIVGVARKQALRGETVSLALLRRGIQELADAARGREALLAGLTRIDLPEMHDGLHGAAIAVLVTLMCERLGVQKRDLMSLALGALVVDLARDAWPLTPAWSREDIREKSIAAIAKVVSLSSSEAVERAALAFESVLPVSNDPDGLKPSSGARLVRVATVYQILTLPPPPHRGLRPDHALSIMSAANERFDEAAIRLLVASIGQFPAASLVKLSNGRTGVVASIPEQGSKLDRPAVRLISKDGKGGQIVELSRQLEVRIVETLDTREKRINPVRYLLI
ncbi:MAG: hypothetical protein HYV07_23145 [Deltaproteobacteria bacterium]|nr:hypothetical protein [Deltaproteobacteria bacterium]